MGVDEVASELNPTIGEKRTTELYRTLLGLLARGEPVSPDDLTAASGLPADEVRRELTEFADLETDEHGRIVGYGLTLRPTPHRFTVDGHHIYTWCALDTLVFPALLGQAASVESPCQATGIPIRVEVHPSAGVTSVEPPAAVVSIVTPGQLTSLRTAFCNQVHFFSSGQAAQPWLEDHPDASVLTVAEAHRIGQTLIPTLLGTTTDHDCC